MSGTKEKIVAFVNDISIYVLVVLMFFFGIHDIQSGRLFIGSMELLIPIVLFLMLLSDIWARYKCHRGGHAGWRTRGYEEGNPEAGYRICTRCGYEEPLRGELE